MEQVTSIVNSENVLSVLAVVVVVGFGFFIDRRVWPWFVEFSEKMRQGYVGLKTKDIEAREKNDARWYRTSEQFIQELRTASVSMAHLRAKQDEILGQITGLREQLDDLEQYGLYRLHASRDTNHEQPLD